MDKSNLNKAFRALRTKGFIALQNHFCCSGCAGYDIQTRFNKAIEAGRPVPKGFAFYHNQDNNSLVENGECYIAFGGFHNQHKDALYSSYVGEIVVQELEKVGIWTKWNGDPDFRIHIKL